MITLLSTLNINVFLLIPQSELTFIKRAMHYTVIMKPSKISIHSVHHIVSFQINVHFLSEQKKKYQTASQTSVLLVQFHPYVHRP